MAITCHELMSLAHWQRRMAGEPWRRCALSRAYYAAYHRCLSWEASLRYPSQAAGSGGIHQQLIDRLKSPHPACSAAERSRSLRLGRLLEAQRSRRVQADYKRHRDVATEALQAQLNDAQRVFAECGG